MEEETGRAIITKRATQLRGHGSNAVVDGEGREGGLIVMICRVGGGRMSKANHPTLTLYGISSSTLTR